MKVILISKNRCTISIMIDMITKLIKFFVAFIFLTSLCSCSRYEYMQIPDYGKLRLEKGMISDYEKFGYFPYRYYMSDSYQRCLSIIIADKRHIYLNNNNSKTGSFVGYPPLNEIYTYHPIDPCCLVIGNVVCSTRNNTDVKADLDYLIPSLRGDTIYIYDDKLQIDTLVFSRIK